MKFLAGKLASRNGQDFLIKEEGGGIRLRGLVQVEIGDIVAVVGREIDRNLFKVERQETISSERFAEILKHRKMVSKFKNSPLPKVAGILNSMPLPDDEFMFAFKVKQQADGVGMKVVTSLQSNPPPKSVFEALSQGPISISELKSMFPNDDVDKIITELQCDGIAFEMQGKICLL